MGSRPASRCIPVCLVLVAVLSGCTMQHIPKEESRFYSIKTGSKLVLNRSLTIPRNEVSVHLQNGKVLPYREVRQYYPNCKFELFPISEQPRTVEPDTFVIHRIVNEMQEVSAARPRYASTADGMGYADNGGPMVYNFNTTLYLDSAVQPDVYRMSCRQLDDLWKTEYLSIDEMRQAWGKIFTLQLADP
jgi:hypothetical protein